MTTTESTDPNILQVIANLCSVFNKIIENTVSYYRN